MTRWLREAYSPTGLVFAWVLAWGFGASTWLVFLSAVGQWPDDDTRFIVVSVACVVLFLFGGYRACRAHPLLKSGYAEWLARTPWRPTDPLPDGPVHPVLQDAVAAAVLVAPALYFDPGRAWAALLALIAGYQCALSLLVAATRPRSSAYLAGFGFGCVMLAARLPALCLGLTVVTGLVLAAGYRRSLRLLPWSMDYDRALVNERNELGWPYRGLGPGPSSPLFANWERVVVGLLVGWLTFVVGVHLDGVEDSEGAVARVYYVVTPVVGLAAFARLLGFLVGYLPPISLSGRLTTGRFVIPAYDGVFVAPVLALVVAGGTPFVEELTGVWSPVVAGVGMAVGLTVVLAGRPDLRRWQLTAPARLTWMPTDKTPKPPMRTTNR